MPRLLTFLSIAFLSASASADVLFQFNTADSTTQTNDDGYDPAVVTLTLDPTIIAPSTGLELSAGAIGLSRFWNSEWAGFSLSSANGPTIDNGTEFATGYLTWTITADPGITLNLSSLSFNSAEGGSTGNRGFNLFAAVNGGSFSFGDTALATLADETGTRAAPIARSFDLSGAAFQGINSITFRYYPITPAAGNTVDFSNVVVNGSAVPEPSAFLGLIGGLAMLAGLQRCRRA